MYTCALKVLACSIGFESCNKCVSPPSLNMKAAMAGWSVPCCSHAARLPRLAFSLTYVSAPPLRFPSCRLHFRSSPPLICPRSFFQEGTDNSPGSHATHNSQGQLNRKPLLSNASDPHDKDEKEASTNEPSLAGAEKYECSEDAAAVDDGQELEDGLRMTRVSDRLIEVFLIEKTTAEEWRKLLAFSKEWPNIRTHFYKRCRVRAEQEPDPERKGSLLKLSRKLKEVDEDMERHNKLLEHVKENEKSIDTVVAKQRKDFTNDFFRHLELLYQASYQQPDQQQELSRVAEKCAAAIEAHDRTTEEEEAISAAQMKFDDILNSPSLDVARNKIDELAKRNQLDSTLMLLITKAWAASKESTMMKEEVKDILYHLYVIARGNMQRLVPKEVRIIRHVLSLEDPKEQIAALTEAFAPGAELEGKDVDLLYTTPEQLHSWVMIVLDAYYNNQRSSLMKSAQELMSPATIKRLEMLKQTIRDQFL